MGTRAWVLVPMLILARKHSGFISQTTVWDCKVYFLGLKHRNSEVQKYWLCFPIYSKRPNLQELLSFSLKRPSIALYFLKNSTILTSKVFIKTLNWPIESLSYFSFSLPLQLDSLPFFISRKAGFLGSRISTQSRLSPKGLWKASTSVWVKSILQHLWPSGQNVPSIET